MHRSRPALVATVAAVVLDSELPGPSTKVPLLTVTAPVNGFPPVNSNSPPLYRPPVFTMPLFTPFTVRPPAPVIEVPGPLSISSRLVSTLTVAVEVSVNLRSVANEALACKVPVVEKVRPFAKNPMAPSALTANALPALLKVMPPVKVLFGLGQRHGAGERAKNQAVGRATADYARNGERPCQGKVADVGSA